MSYKCSRLRIQKHNFPSWLHLLLRIPPRCNKSHSCCRTQCRCHSKMHKMHFYNYFHFEKYTGKLTIWKMLNTVTKREKLIYCLNYCNNF